MAATARTLTLRAIVQPTGPRSERPVHPCGPGEARARHVPGALAAAVPPPGSSYSVLLEDRDGLLDPHVVVLLARSDAILADPHRNSCDGTGIDPCLQVCVQLRLVPGEVGITDVAVPHLDAGPSTARESIIV